MSLETGTASSTNWLLGFGTLAMATVWLVKDLTTGRWAALKILVADVSQTSKLDALCHLERARGVDKDSEGEFVLELFDDFQIEGPKLNGTHQCVVSKLLATRLLVSRGHPIFVKPSYESIIRRGGQPVTFDDRMHLSRTLPDRAACPALSSVPTIPYVSKSRSFGQAFLWMAHPR